MKVDAVTHQPWVRPSTLFRAFKYLVYCLLALNVYLFFREDTAAAREVFATGVDWGNFVEAFSATIDTAAWVLLLLLFELETAVIPDERLRGRLKWLLMGIRSVCYLFIIWSFWGYCAKLGLLVDVQAFAVSDVCTLVGSHYTYIADLDEYLPLDAATCVLMNGQELLRIEGTDIIGTAAAVAAAEGLAIVDVINAGDWLLIVLLLEIEVLMQLRGQLGDRVIRLFKYLKVILYTTLFMAAIYWWFLGDFLDFWDAFLWLVAFLIIELNIFNWHEEVREEELHGHGAVSPAHSNGRIHTATEGTDP